MQAADEAAQPLLRARAAAPPAAASAADASPVALGRALALVLDADKRAFQRAAAHVAPGRVGAAAGADDVLAGALLALRTHVARGGDAPWSGHDPLLSPLLDAVVRSKAGGARPPAWRALRWLLAQREGGDALGARLLAACSDADKRVRLGAALTLRHMCEAADQPDAPPPLPPGAKAPGALAAACETLAASVARDGAVRDGAPAPTRLTAACADALLCASMALCGAAAHSADPPLASHADELLWQVAPSLEALARAMAAWGRAPGGAVPLRSLALDEAARHVSNVRTHGDQPSATLPPVAAAAAAEPADSDDEADAAIAAAALPPRVVATRALAACWAQYAPLMLCEPRDSSAAALAAAAERWLSTLASATAAGVQGDVSRRRAEAAQLHALTCVALLAAAAEAHPDGGAAALDAPGWAAAPRALMGTLRSPNERVTALAVAALRCVLLPSGGVSCALGQAGAASGWGARAQAALDALTPLLDERDGVSRAGVALTGELIARQPGLSALRAVFDKLGAPSADARRNALDAIAEALSRGAGQAPQSAGSSEPDAHALLPEYAAALAEKILPCLSDADLATRHAAAALLGRLSLDSVLPPLLALAAHRDGRTRSAAAEALRAVLRCHAPPAHALAALLATVSAQPVPAKPPAHPGQIADATPDAPAAPATPPGSDAGTRPEAGAERAIDALRKWAAEDVASADWPPLTDTLLNAMAAAPGNAVLVRAAAALGGGMGASGGPGAHAMSRVRALLASQPPAASAAAAVEGDAASAAALFARLSPLLVLRVLPLEAFEDPLAEQDLYGDLPPPCDADAPPGAPPTCIAAALLRRIADPTEAADVCRVAAELAGRLRPSSAWSHLQAALLRGAARRTPMRALRAALLAACSALAARGVAAFPTAQPQRVLLAALTRVLTWNAESGDDVEEVMKTQMGVLDFLAALIAAQLDAGSGTSVGGVRITELGADAEENVGCGDVLTSLLAVIAGGADALPWLAADDAAAVAAAEQQLRACCANAVIAAGRHAGPRARSALAQRVLPTVARALSRGGVPAAVRPAAFQILFATAHQAGGAAAPFAADLADLASAALRAAGREDSATRLAAAKLLTALLASDESVHASLAGSWKGIADAVRAVASMDASAELRAVCDTLARALGAHA